MPADDEKRLPARASGPTEACRASVEATALKIQQRMLASKHLGAHSQSPHQIRVQAFLEGIRRPIPDAPSVPSRELLRTMGITLLEEVFEWLEAAGLYVSYDAGGALSVRDVTFAGLKVNVDSGLKPDLVQLAKEAADVSVVNAGNMISCGIRDGAVLSAVDENNLLKVANGRYDEQTGKFLKPPGHPKPDIVALLREQGWAG